MTAVEFFRITPLSVDVDFNKEGLCGGDFLGDYRSSLH